MSAGQDSRASFHSTSGGVIRVRLLHPCANPIRVRRVLSTSWNAWGTRMKLAHG